MVSGREIPFGYALRDAFSAEKEPTRLQNYFKQFSMNTPKLYRTSLVEDGRGLKSDIQVQDLAKFLKKYAGQFYERNTT